MMEGLQLVLGALANAAWFWKALGLVAFILLMVTSVGLLYSGDVQNTEIGPISFRGRSNQANDALAGPKTIITSALDQKRAHCSIYFAYVDRRGRSRKQLLYRAPMRLSRNSVNMVRANKDDLIGYWCSPHFDEIYDQIEASGLRPDNSGLFSRSAENADGKSLPEHISNYIAQENDETTTVAVSPRVAETLSKRFRIFMLRQCRTYDTAKTKSWHWPWKPAPKALFEALPDLTQDGHYFVEMRFSIWPHEILANHPDGQVKTTAWLTVLTSLFAMFMQFLYNGLG